MTSTYYIIQIAKYIDMNMMNLLASMILLLCKDLSHKLWATVIIMFRLARILRLLFLNTSKYVGHADELKLYSEVGTHIRSLFEWFSTPELLET